MGTATTAFGDLLRRYRAAAALSQEDLAEKAGLSARGVSDLERGERRAPHLATIRLLADALDLGEEERAAFAAAAQPGLATQAASAAARPSSLPAPPTPLIGREREVAAGVEVLRRPDVRLVTFTGPGGIGKTRLAIRLAQEVAGDFPEGVWFVLLAKESDAGLVAAAVAATLGVTDAGARPLEEVIAAFLAPRQALVVLDNFEHVLPAAPFVASLLTSCPSLRILVTSRQALHVSGEYVVPVPALASPDLNRLPAAVDLASIPSVRLFVERARASQGDFALTEEVAPAVAAICHRLGGLPLAIELAAARSRHASPQTLLARMDRSLPLLVGGPLDAPARQRTMRDAVDWSYRLLSDPEQRLFRALSVFVGGFDLEAAEAVTTAGGAPTVDAFDGVAALLDHSLLIRGDDEAGATRYTMLEPIREFGQEQLAADPESAAVRRAHATHFLALAEALRPRIEGPDGPAVLRRMEVDQANLRAALGWAVANDETELAQRLVLAVWKFWWVRRHLSAADARAWFDAVLDLSGGRPEFVPEIRYAAGGFALGRGDLAEVHRQCEAGLVIARATESAFRSMACSSCSATPRGWAAGRRRRSRDTRQRSRSWSPFSSRCPLPTTRWQCSSPDSELRPMPLANSTGRRRGRGGARHLAGPRRQVGDRDRATQLGGDRGRTRRRLRAAEFYLEGVGLHWEIGDAGAVAEGVAGLAGVATTVGLADAAARLLGAAEALGGASGIPGPAVIVADRAATIEAVGLGLGEDEFAVSFRTGRSMTAEETIVFAESLPAAIQAAAPPPSPRRSAATGGLSRRELEVLRLVAEGRTDAEAAEILFIARRTVTSHLTSIYTKLGVDNRAAAAVYATRRGLI